MRQPLIIVCISDTHELHRELLVPPGDMLIHAGDFCHISSARKIAEFNDWLGTLPHRHKILVPGNHDRILAEQSGLRMLITNAHLLINEGVTIEGLTIWGSPVTCDDTAFGFDGTLRRRTLYQSIPQGTDIIVTHGPPQGILDLEFEDGPHRGCGELLAAVRKVRPRIHIFGHVHPSYGTQRVGDTLCVNAALFGWAGDLENPPVTMNLENPATAHRGKLAR